MSVSTMKPLLDSLPKLPPNNKKLVSLFSGGGLLDLGFIHAGYEIVWANDFELAPCVAYRHNIGDHIVHGDITSADVQALIPQDVDGIIGGPPCQDFSVAGKGEGENGERGKLVWTYLSIIERIKPKFFLFENVKGLTTKKHRPTLDALVKQFEEIGYTITWEVKSAWDYGVAQKRERVFIVGIRKDLGVKFAFPQSEYEANGYRPVLRDAIGDLPEPLGKELSAQAHDYLERDPRHLQKHPAPTLDEPAPTLPAVLHKGVPYGLFRPDNHIEQPLTDAVYKHAKGHNIGYHPDIEQPAATVRTKGEDVTEHPKPRRFTVRECLRIQSVPDTYVFPAEMKVPRVTKNGVKNNHKKYSLSAMYKVVGNGVPSRMAYRFAVAIANHLDNL
jgi:DNA (cytosine-5)-methyltransferase 1